MALLQADLSGQGIYLGPSGMIPTARGYHLPRRHDTQREVRGRAREMLLTSVLVGIGKPKGGVRPIAVGEVFTN